MVTCMREKQIDVSFQLGVSVYFDRPIETYNPKHVQQFVDNAEKFDSKLQIDRIQYIRS